LQAQALQRLLPHLPAKDSLSVGGFSQELRWWTQGRSVGQALRQRLPPGDQRPGGPTNLEAALAATIAQVEGDAPKQLLLVSDTEAQIDDPESLARGLKRTQIRLHVLAIGQGKAGALLKNLAEGSGGGFMQSLEPRGWTDSLRQLARGAMGDRLMRRTVRAQLASELNWPGGLSIDLWNRVWLKETALLLGRVDEPDGAPLMGRWQLGQGVVLAAAFGPPRELALALADSVARPPRDPRFAVSVSAQSQVRIGVEAVDQGASMNGLALELELRGDDEVRTHALQQSGPGQYEIVLPASRAPQVGVLRLGQRVIDQVVLPGRYPAEFERIGIDEQALHQLALRSGGAVVWPWQKQPLKLRVRQGRMGLMPWLAAAGGLLIGAGLIRWRYC
jgi:hypothetical protein